MWMTEVRKEGGGRRARSESEKMKQKAGKGQKEHERVGQRRSKEKKMQGMRRR